MRHVEKFVGGSGDNGKESLAERTVWRRQRGGLQAFSVVPVIVYKVFPDGHEELIRGADILGTPLASFAKILATGDTASVFNGFCGAESGTPVTIVRATNAAGEL